MVCKSFTAKPKSIACFDRYGRINVDSKLKINEKLAKISSHK